MFQAWLSQLATDKCGYLMKTLGADGGTKLILSKLQAFCNKRGILIKYTAPYIYKENGLAEQGWRMIVTIKDSILINSWLPNRF